MNQLYEDQEVHDFVSDTHVSVGTHVLPLMASFALFYGSEKKYLPLVSRNSREFIR